MQSELTDNKRDMETLLNDAAMSISPVDEVRGQGSKQEWIQSQISLYPPPDNLHRRSRQSGMQGSLK